MLECTIATAYGSIAIELSADAAPRTVANFLKYVDAKAYHGGSFTRAVKLPPSRSRIRSTTATGTRRRGAKTT